MDIKKTYGSQVIDHNSLYKTLDDDVIEYRREMEKDVIGNINAVITQALIDPQYTNRDFYIVLLMKVERLGQAPRTFVFARLSCPTPTYKQSVWKYHHFSGHQEFLWSIPDKILYYHIVNNSQKYLQDHETVDLAKFVLLMESKELLEWVRRENGEQQDAVILIKEQDA